MSTISTSELNKGKSAVEFYLNHGIPRGAAIAIVSCLWHESKLNPGGQGHQATETPGVLNPEGAYGIASWNGSRQADLNDYAKAHNLPYDQLDTQLLFVLTEIANRAQANPAKFGRLWAIIRDPDAGYEDIIPHFVHSYEQPANEQGEINDAMAYATELAPLIPVVEPVPQMPIPAPPKPVQPVSQPAPVPTPQPTPEKPPAPATVAPTRVSGSMKPDGTWGTPAPAPAPHERPVWAPPLLRGQDAEIAAIEQTWELLSPWSPEARKRIMAYLEARLGL